MKVQAASNNISTIDTKAGINSKPGQIDFKSIYQAASKHLGFKAELGLSQIDKIKDSIIQSKNLNPRTILEYQIHISELNLRVELLSKAAESATSLARKIHNGQ